MGLHSELREIRRHQKDCEIGKDLRKAGSRRVTILSRTISDYFIVNTNLMISLRHLTRHRRQEARRTRRNESSPGFEEATIVAGGISGNILREIKAIGAIYLQVQEARCHDAALEIYS